MADRYILIVVYERLVKARCVANSVNVACEAGCDLVAKQNLRNLC